MSPLALSKVAPTRLDCCENGLRRQRRRRGVDSSIPNLFAGYFSNPAAATSLFCLFCTNSQLQLVSPARPLLAQNIKQWFPHAAVTFPRPRCLLRSQLSVPGPRARSALHFFLPISFLPIVIHTTSQSVNAAISTEPPSMSSPGTLRVADVKSAKVDELKSVRRSVV